MVQLDNEVAGLKAAILDAQVAQLAHIPVSYAERSTQTGADLPPPPPPPPSPPTTPRVAGALGLFTTSAAGVFVYYHLR